MIKLRNLFCFILTIVCFWYQISGTRNPATGARNWYQFLVPVSGQYVMGIPEAHMCVWTTWPWSLLWPVLRGTRHSPSTWFPSTLPWLPPGKRNKNLLTISVALKRCLHARTCIAYTYVIQVRTCKHCITLHDPNHELTYHSRVLC